MIPTAKKTKQQLIDEGLLFQQKAREYDDLLQAKKDEGEKNNKKKQQEVEEEKKKAEEKEEEKEEGEWVEDLAVADQ